MRRSVERCVDMPGNYTQHLL